jgi:hypothetical protein
MSDLNRFLSKDSDEESDNSSLKPNKEERKKPKIINRGKSPSSLQKLDKKQIIHLLESLMTEIPGFASNLAWTRQKILPKDPQIHPEELAQILAIPLLEAYVILEQLNSD